LFLTPGIFTTGGIKKKNNNNNNKTFVECRIAVASKALAELVS